jgi:membrane protease YdiL (CAAX protease family)
VVEKLLGSDPSFDWFIKALPETIAQLGVFLIVMAVLPGLCEETLFRGAIQGTFEKRGVWKGVIYAAILFAVYHLNPWNFIPAIALGVLFGLVTVRTNSILPAMVCHVSNNCMGVISLHLSRR